LFGYFATYSLGNLYAGSLHKALRAHLPDLDSDLERGHLTGATDWLAQRVQRFGGLKSPHDTITQACGFAPDATHLLDYLEEKFTG
jgi:carboxypeptidase Taq